MMATMRRPAAFKRPAGAPVKYVRHGVATARSRTERLPTSLTLKTIYKDGELAFIRRLIRSGHLKDRSCCQCSARRINHLLVGFCTEQVRCLCLFPAESCACLYLRATLSFCP